MAATILFSTFPNGGTKRNRYNRAVERKATCYGLHYIGPQIGKSRYDS